MLVKREEEQKVDVKVEEVTP